MIPRPTGSTLFPYTTLFRSLALRLVLEELAAGPRRGRSRAAAPAQDHEPRGQPREHGGKTGGGQRDRKSTRLNSSHGYISYAVFCLKKKKRERRESVRYGEQ